jgi:DnaJ-class molecular chaperone
MIPPLPLPALVEVPCPDCLGEGGWDDEHGPLMCFTCCGTGKVERCSGCHETPAVINGMDACGCNREVLYGISVGWLEAA